MPYQVLGSQSGTAALMTWWRRSAMARSSRVKPFSVSVLVFAAFFSGIVPSEVAASLNPGRAASGSGGVVGRGFEEHAPGEGVGEHRGGVDAAGAPRGQEAVEARAEA